MIVWCGAFSCESLSHLHSALLNFSKVSKVHNAANGVPQHLSHLVEREKWGWGVYVRNGVESGESCEWVQLMVQMPWGRVAQQEETDRLDLWLLRTVDSVEGDKDVNPFAHSHFPNSSSISFWSSPYPLGVASGQTLLQLPSVAVDYSSGFSVRETLYLLGRYRKHKG